MQHTETILWVTSITLSCLTGTLDSCTSPRLADNNTSDRCCIHNKDGNLDNQKQSGGQQFTNALGGGWNGQSSLHPKDEALAKHL